mmetsp:Transcript_43317/g.108527  ORF Transcript_43317/g.108527 Transcript_43317/m.108527 type:complete len:156 (+) Transcript_43317:174-641(+)
MFEAIVRNQMGNLSWQGSMEDYVSAGMYAKHLDSWFEAFSRRQFLVIEFSRLVHGDTARELSRIASFLGVDSASILRAWNAEKALNRNLTKPKTMGDIPCGFMQEFADYYAPFNAAFYKLLADTKQDAPEGQEDVSFPDPMRECRHASHATPPGG